MMTLSFLNKKNTINKKAFNTLFWWKIYLCFLALVLFLIITISYRLFSKADQDPFVADTTKTVTGIKQYDANKIQKIKTYFDEKALIYTQTLSVPLSIKDPSI